MERDISYSRTEQQQKQLQDSIQKSREGVNQTIGAAMEPTLVNNLSEEIGRLRARLLKLETLRDVLVSSGVGTMHGAIQIY